MSPAGPPRIEPVPPGERGADFADTIAGAGPGAERFNIFTTLARHPRLFRRWIAFAGTLLLKSELPARERELVILRTLWLVRARNEWFDHVRIAGRAGVTTDEVSQVMAGPDHPGWNPIDAALVRVADELHERAEVSDATWATLAAQFDERQLIELPFLAGQYHLVGYVCNALRIAPDAHTPTDSPLDPDHRR